MTSLKQKLFTVGSLLTSGLVISLFWLVFGVKALSITEVECFELEHPCSDQLEDEIKQYFTQKHFFTTDFSSLPDVISYDLVTFSKEFPGKITVTIRPSVFNLESSQALDQQVSDDAVHAVGTSLGSANIQYLKIEYIEDQHVLKIQLNEGVQALLRTTHLEEDTEKLILVLNNIDLDQIDLAISEVDVRYTLPVLRQDQTSFN